MKPLHLQLSAFSLLVLPVMAFAQSVTTQFPFSSVDVSRYTDGPWDRTTNVDVSALTKMGIVQGNDDGTFAPNRHLNRAEFVQIIMRITNSHSAQLNCFADVATSAWYADAVCSAKAAGLVRGNAVAGVDPSLWRFEPNRDIQYEEAVKILAMLYAMPVSGSTEGDLWYVPYLRAASDASVDINGLTAGDHITRAEMAQLTINFVAWSQGRLTELRNAENGVSSSSSSSSSRMSSSSSSRSSSSSSRSSSSTSSVVGETVRSHIVTLGTLSPTLASTNIFSNNEPVDVNGVTVTFASPVQSIASLVIYDGSGAQIGTATAVSGSSTQFHAVISANKLLLPYRMQEKLFVKARLKTKDTGGISGEFVQVATVTVQGEGRWSNDAYTSSSNETFPESETAYAKITGIVNSGTSNAVLTTGQGRVLADFTVSADTPESQNQIHLNDLSFSIDQAGGVTLANVSLRNEDNSVESPCSVSSTMITCTSIDPSIGTVDQSQRFRLVGDVTVPLGANNPLLQIVLNDPGTSAISGDLNWSDGVTTFTWVDLSQPVVSGTLWK